MGSLKCPLNEGEDSIDQDTTTVDDGGGVRRPWNIFYWDHLRGGQASESKLEAG